MRVVRRPDGSVVARFGVPSLIEKAGGRRVTRLLKGALVSNIWFVYLYGTEFHDKECDACASGYCVKKVLFDGPGTNPKKDKVISIEHDTAEELN
jgi:hypothetical protein